MDDAIDLAAKLALLDGPSTPGEPRGTVNTGDAGGVLTAPEVEI